MLKHVDLFAGTGAFTLACQGYYETVFANDCSKHAEKLYRLNYSTPFILGKLEDLPLESYKALTGEVDLLTAGFPCQPFSLAGNRQGFSDRRTDVVWTLLSFIKEVKPRVVLIENVKNLLTIEQGQAFQRVNSALEEQGYSTVHKVLNSTSFGLPHNRERLFIFAFLEEKQASQYQFPKGKEDPPPLSIFLEDFAPDAYYYSSRYKVWEIIKEGVVKPISTNTLYQLRRHYIRENKSGVCPTLTANMGTGGHNVPLLLDSKGIRKLTPRECFNLQGFPKEFALEGIADSALYHLSGNAVSVPVVRALIAEVARVQQL